MPPSSNFSTSLKNLRRSSEYRTLADEILKHSQNTLIDFCYSPGNYGDALINVGTRQFFENNKITVAEYSRAELLTKLEDSPDEMQERLLVVGGGGGWSKNFSSTRSFVEKMTKAYRQVLVLPTTYALPPVTSTNIIYFARDKQESLENIPSAKFCHDMAFYFEASIPSTPSKIWRLFAFREDREGHQHNKLFNRNIDVSLLGDGTYKDAAPFFSLIHNFQQVFTDRLHIAIAASMLGKRVTFTSGNYSKNRDVFSSSIQQNYPDTEFLNFQEILEKYFPAKLTSGSDNASSENTSDTTPTVRTQASAFEAEGTLWKILKTNPLVLPIHSQLFREPPRAYSQMNENYLSRYDGHTIASDVFCTNSDLFFVGPPLLNLRTVAMDQNLVIDGEKATSSGGWIEKNRMALFHHKTSARPEQVELDFGAEHFSVRPSSSHLDAFAGLNVVITLNRDNHLDNIRDWLINMVSNHGVQAAVIYDNRSQTYSVNQLLALMKTVPGLNRGFVVDWPHKYGNTGGPNQIWDSDFGQYMCWEHARWRFLQKANCVIISDVDEIPISSTGKTLVEHVSETKSGVFTYPVRDSPAIPRSSLEARRTRLHTDYLYSDLKRGPYSKKVVYQPKRIPSEAQIGNHQVIGADSTYSEEVISRHVSGVHLSWRSLRWDYSHKERSANSETEFFDQELETHYKKTFPERF